jgi:signal transduction histidine kinase
VTFRRRLTLSFAIASATSLTIFLLSVAIVGAFALTRSASSMVQHTAQEVRQTLQRDARQPRTKILADLRSLAVPDAVFYRVNPSVTSRDRRMRRPPPSGIWNPADLIGLGPNIVPLPGGGDVLVAGDLARIEATLRLYAAALVGLEIVVLIGSWVLGRRIARRAMAPLDAIREELERFGRGDFTTRPVASAKSQDLETLVTAYNAAAEQVGRAFAERALVENETRQFLAEAAHQMRTPITVISGSLDLLAHRGADDADLREITYPLMHSQTARLRRLVERIMRLASLQRSEPAGTEVVDVGDVVRAVISAVSGSRRCECELRDDSTFTYVWGSADELYDAIENLVDNAAKYGRGNVVVEISNSQHQIVVRVIDDGPGISGGDRPRLFERFFRGVSSHDVEGTGLGLAIARRAAERAGGSAHLESSSPEGSTFSIVLPAFLEAADTRTALTLD